MNQYSFYQKIQAYHELDHLFLSCFAVKNLGEVINFQSLSWQFMQIFAL